ncbi:hypothetical protein IKH83_02890 [Candidatus Saccharibacteria bacterium]|nr:hypothetical protein [Candidatus Saccharibacteria bacterium]
MRRRDKRILPACLGIFVAISLLTFLLGRFKSNTADAADLSKFDPGYIISDYTMSNYNSMTEAEIQAFLTKKNPCNNRDYDLYQRLSANNPNVSWHWKDGHFVCLSEELFGDGMTIGEGKTAAKIIYETAQEYKINPQVLIVLIEKESSLITDTIPNNYDYRTMTGFGCPDTAPCDAKYFGFKNQIRKAAWLFREVLDGGWTNYPLGENYVQYNPNAACGGSIVNIKNLATSALYRYTPYQPNAGALAAGTGTAYCGAYGNRNFYIYFENWFGGITDASVDWQDMSSPRMMTVTQRTLLIDALKMGTTSQWLNVGDDYYFTKKTMVVWGGEKKACLQRQSDENTNYCVLEDRMTDFSTEDNIEILAGSQKYQVQQWTCIVNLVNLSAECGKKAYSAGDILTITKTINIDGVEYLIDGSMDDNYAILKKRTEPIIEFEKIGPVTMKLTKNSYKQRINDGAKVQNLTTSSNQFINITDKIVFAGKTYYRTSVDSALENNYIIPAEALSSDIFAEFKSPRNLTFNKDTYTMELATGLVCSEYKKGETRKFSKKIEYNGKIFFQGESDKGSQCVVDMTNLNESEYSFSTTDTLKLFENFMNPRELKIASGSYLVDAKNGQTCSEYLPAGTTKKYTTKIVINGIVFFRDETSTTQESTCVMPAKNLKEL